MSIDAIVYILISSVFGLWLASRKTFIIIPNSEYNTYLTRAFFSVPYSVILISLICALSYLPVIAFPADSGNVPSFLQDYMTFSCIEALILDLIFIAVCHFYIIPGKYPEEIRKDFNEHEFYLFRPISYDFVISRQRPDKERVTGDVSSYDTAADPCSTAESSQDGVRDAGLPEFYFRTPKNKDMNILSGKDGLLILRKDAAEILEDKGLTGYHLKPVVCASDRKRYADKAKDTEKQTDPVHKPDSDHPENRYFRLYPEKRLPAVSEKTVFEVRKSSVAVKDEDVYYNLSDINVFKDFNEMNEETGKRADRSRKLILSAKAVKIFISEFGYGRIDFVPVHFIGDQPDDSVIIKE